jgi:hypothetical protein
MGEHWGLISPSLLHPYKEVSYVIILAIPYYNFKEKMAITKQYRDKGKVEILDGLVYVEMINYDMNN